MGRGDQAAGQQPIEVDDSPLCKRHANGRLSPLAAPATGHSTLIDRPRGVGHPQA